MLKMQGQIHLKGQGAAVNAMIDAFWEDGKFDGLNIGTDTSEALHLVSSVT